MARVLGLILLCLCAFQAQAQTYTYGGDPILCQAAVVARNACLFYAQDQGGAPTDNWYCENNNTVHSPDWSRKWYLKLNGHLYNPGSGVQSLFHYSCADSNCEWGLEYTFPWENNYASQTYCHEGCLLALDSSYGVMHDGWLVFKGTGDPCVPCDPDTDSNCCPPWDPDCGNGEECSFEVDPECYCTMYPDAWECEGDHDPGAGCESDTPSCDGFDLASCQIMIRTHRTHCAAERLIAAEAESRAALVNAVSSVMGSVEAQTVQLGSKLDGIKSAVEGISPGDVSVDNSGVVTAIESGTTSTTSAITSQTTSLGSKLDGIKSAVEGIGFGDVDIDNSGVVTAIGDQTAAIVGPSVDPGSGVSPADMDALTVRSVTGAPVGPSVIDMQGYLGSSCPAFDVAFTLGGIPWELDNSLWCDFLAIINACMHVLAAWWAVMILLGK